MLKLLHGERLPLKITFMVKICTLTSQKRIPDIKSAEVLLVAGMLEVAHNVVTILVVEVTPTALKLWRLSATQALLNYSL